MCKVSLILCTHNPRADYLQRTLASLRGQSLPIEQWELLIVDNASEQSLAETLDLSWHQDARCIREDEIGLTQARLRGIREARAEQLIFVDDDNLLAPDYLAQAMVVRATHPFLGAYGAGILTPEFEVEPARVISPLLPLLALRAVAAPAWSNNPRNSEAIPWGAGLCVTRAVAEHYRRLVGRLNASAVLGRRGVQLFCGEDDLFAWAAAATGCGFGIFPELRIRHLIPALRLEREYLLRLVHDHGYSHGVLRYLLTGVMPSPTTLTRRVHLLLHGLRNGRFSMKTHWATARGEARAARFISENRLKPVAAAEPEVSAMRYLSGVPLTATE